LEIRLNDFINQGTLSPEEAQDALVSYAAAEEGTNTLQ
jgi:hypothetical protein